MRNIRKIWSIILALAFILGGLGLSGSTVRAAGFKNAITIKPGTTTTTIKESAEQQIITYKIEVTSPGYVDLDFHFEDVGYGPLYFYCGDNPTNSSNLKFITINSDTQVANLQWSYLLAPGNYYVVYKNEHRYIGGSRNYLGGTLQVTYNFTPIEVSGEDKEDNNSIPKAVSWDYKRKPSIKGYFPSEGNQLNNSIDDYDTYKIYVDSDAEYTISYGSNRNGFVRVYDSSGNMLYSYYAYYSSVYDLDYVNKTIKLSTGTYYISIDSTNRASYYELSFEKVVSKQSDSGNNNNTSNNSSNSNTTTSYSNEWVNGKWYDSQGKQTYKGTLSWKSNSKGWWVEDSQGWYPTNSWQKIDGVWYFFRPDGYMASGEYYYGYWFNYNGSWDASYYLTWRSNSRGWWVEDRSGWWPANKWLKIDGCWYYFNGSGYMVTNQYVDGYWIGADGVCR